MITRFELENFTAFSNLEIDFSPKINVIIGDNDTGKTNLLKAAYGICVADTLLRNGHDHDAEQIETVLTTRFQRLFLPLEGGLGRMHRYGARSHARLGMKFARGREITATFSEKSEMLTIRRPDSRGNSKSDAVFIPTKEVLSFMEGFSSLYERYELSFDQTYKDICLLLDLPEVHPEKLHEKVKWAMEEIERICGGRFVFPGGGRVVFKTAKEERSANSVASGFCKVGMLFRLLETGAIQPGVSGPLFWDEPESNLNPKMMELLVRILQELSRNGQQVIVATHDYVLLKWFDLLSDGDKDDHIRFHSLYKEPETGEIGIASTDDYLEITPNPIDEAFGCLIDRQIENDMGTLGK